MADDALHLPARVTIDETAALAGQLPAQVRGGSGVLRVDALAPLPQLQAQVSTWLQTGDAE